MFNSDPVGQNGGEAWPGIRENVSAGRAVTLDAETPVKILENESAVRLKMNAMIFGGSIRMTAGTL